MRSERFLNQYILWFRSGPFDTKLGEHRVHEIGKIELWRRF
jgi:hypothetical protein